MRTTLGKTVLSAVGLFVTAPAGGLALADEPVGDHIAVAPEAIEWTAGPPTLPAGAKAAVLEGDPTKPGIFTLRLQLPPNYVIPPHRHPEAERVTVLAGSVNVGFGEKVDRKDSTRFRAGSFYVNPAKAAHFVWTKERAILQITAVGPWQLLYLDPKDDPRTGKGP
jgi:quercetin dioxygenase-like cupin family protein